VKVEQYPIEVPLTLGQIAIIDAEDAHKVMEYKWSCYFCKARGTYVVRRKKTIGVGRYTNEYLHRFITDAPPDKEVDHINHETLDNRRSTNLRVCTRNQNQHNSKLRKDNTSGYKGVHYDKQSKKYRVELMIDKEKKYLGLFLTIIEAARAYNNAAIKYFGEFALINKIPED
jgi:hypothetical protein